MYILRHARECLLLRVDSINTRVDIMIDHNMVNKTTVELLDKRKRQAENQLRYINNTLKQHKN